jgi:sorting nexin-8
MKEDALLAAFLTEPSFELWRKNTPISLDEESVSKRVDRNEEMTIPSDLEEKLAYAINIIRRRPLLNTVYRTLRRKINPLIEQWQRICILAERIIKRREAAAVRIPPAFRPGYLQAHFPLPMFSSTTVSSETSSPASIAPTFASLLAASNMDSFFGLHSEPDIDQGDMARLTNTLRAVVEVNEQCWRGDDCELAAGVRLGLQQVAAHTQRHSELSELRVSPYTLFVLTVK